MRVISSLTTVFEFAVFVDVRQQLKVSELLARVGTNDDGIAEKYASDAISYAFMYFLVTFLICFTLRLFLFKIVAINRLHAMAFTSYSVYQCFTNTYELIVVGLARKCLAHSSGHASDGALPCRGYDDSYNVSDDYVTALKLITGTCKIERFAAATFSPVKAEASAVTERTSLLDETMPMDA